MPQLTYQNKSLFFIHIPKTAGTSLYSNLGKQGCQHWSSTSPEYNPYTPVLNNVSKHHLDIKQIQRYYGIVTNKFTIIRNPWQRTVSDYVYRTKDPTFEKLNNWLLVNLTRAKSDPCWSDNHFKPMYKFIDKNTKVFLFHEMYKVHDWIRKKLDFEFKFNIIENQSIEYSPIKMETVLDDYVANLWLEYYNKDIKLLDKYC